MTSRMGRALGTIGRLSRFAAERSSRGGRWLYVTTRAASCAAALRGGLSSGRVVRAAERALQPVLLLNGQALGELEKDQV